MYSPQEGGAAPSHDEAVANVLAAFPGSEVAFTYEGDEPSLEDQEAEIADWNDYVGLRHKP